MLSSIVCICMVLLLAFEDPNFHDHHRYCPLNLQIAARREREKKIVSFFLLKYYFSDIVSMVGKSTLSLFAGSKNSNIVRKIKEYTYVCVRYFFLERFKFLMQTNAKYKLDPSSERLRAKNFDVTLVESRRFHLHSFR